MMFFLYSILHPAAQLKRVCPCETCRVYTAVYTYGTRLHLYILYYEVSVDTPRMPSATLKL